jgi:hypothetical protein
MSYKTRESKLILIGGASRTSKSRLTNLLNAQGIAKHKRIHEFAFDIAGGIGVGIEKIFDQWNLHLPEIIARTINYTVRNSPVVSDIHFAIQPTADTLFLTKGKVI